MTTRLAADLDHLSHGRLVLGIGWDAAALGWGTNEFERIGLRYPTTRERQEALAEAIAFVKGVWGPVPFSFAGRHYAVKDAQVAPPPEQGVPPIVIAGAGEQGTLRQVAEFADACRSGPVVTGGVDTPVAVLRRHCDNVGRDYGAILRTHVTTWLILAEDDVGVRRKVDRYVPEGLDDTWRRAVLDGTPEQVAARFRAFADAGRPYFVAQTLDARDEETIRLLAGEVVPRVKTAVA